jgi:hypothetical protein
VTVNKLDVVRDDGDTASVRFDVNHAAAVRQRDGTWKPAGARIRGLASLKVVEGHWRVFDYRLRGISRVDSMLPTEAAPSEGDLELEMAITEWRDRIAYTFLVGNRGAATVTLERLEFELPIVWRFSKRLSAQLLDHPVLQPGESWAGTLPGKGQLRSLRGAVAVTASSEERSHRARVRFRPPPRRIWWLRLAAALTLPRVSEVLALAFAVLAWRTSWTLLIVSGAALLFAGVVRAAPLAAYVRLGSRGTGLIAALTLAVAEIAAGSAALFLTSLSWTTFAIWVSLVVYVPMAVHQAGEALRRRK